MFKESTRIQPYHMQVQQEGSKQTPEVSTLVLDSLASKTMRKEMSNLYLLSHLRNSVWQNKCTEKVNWLELERWLGRLRALLTLPQDLSSVPNIHARCLKTICTSNSRGSSIHFWPSQASTYMQLTIIYVTKSDNKSCTKGKIADVILLTRDYCWDK